MTAALQIIGPGSTDRTVTAIRVTGPDGVDRNILEARVIGTDEVDRVFFSGVSPMTLGVTPSYAAGHTSGTGTAVTNSVTAAASGGTAPYSYAWTLLSYTGGTPPTITSALAATTAFTQTGIPSGESISADFRCTSTDANGVTATSDLTATWIDTA